MLKCTVFALQLIRNLEALLILSTYLGNILASKGTRERDPTGPVGFRVISLTIAPYGPPGTSLIHFPWPVGFTFTAQKSVKF